MVWHAYQLNHRNFLEDCRRAGKMDVWKAGLQWAGINSCIDNKTFECTANEKAQSNWKTSTGHAWDSLNDAKDASVPCPMCQKPVEIPWTGWIDEKQWQLVEKGTLYGEKAAKGFADKAMSARCQSCKTSFTGETLKLAKFRKDMEALRFSNVPMPGTVLNIDGEIPRILFEY